MAIVETEDGRRVEFQYSDSDRRRLMAAGFGEAGIADLELVVAGVGTTQPTSDEPTRADVAGAHRRIRNALAELKASLSECDYITRGAMQTTFIGVCRIRLEDFETAVSIVHDAVERVSKPFDAPGKRGGAGFPHELAVSILDTCEKHGIEATDATNGPFAIAYGAAAQAFGIHMQDPRNHLRYALRRAGK